MTTDKTIIIAACIAALPPFIMALLAWRQGVKNEKKADSLLVKAEEIHTLTNSTLSQTTSQLAIANEKIAGLEKLIGALAPKKRRA